MTLPVMLLAQLQGLNPLNPTAQINKTSGLLFKDVLLIIGTGLVLAIPLFLWARYYVRNKQHRRHHRHREHEPAAPGVADDSASDNEGDPGSHRRRRRRRRRRDHRPRNPTLAETGGLPRAKQGDSPPQTS